MFFKYTHNKDYQKLQFDFLDIVNSSGQNDGLFVSNFKVFDFYLKLIQSDVLSLISSVLKAI